MRRMMSIIVVLSLFVAACGSPGNEEISAGGDTQSGPVSAEAMAAVWADRLGLEPSGDVDVEVVSAAVAALVKRYGDDGAFAVGMFALEHGYSHDQVVAGATTGSIARDGQIDGIEPAGPELGIIKVDPTTSLLASYKQVKTPKPLLIESVLRTARERSKDLGPEFSAMVLGSTFLELVIMTMGKYGSTAQDVIFIILLGTKAPEEKTGSGVEADEGTGNIESDERLDSAAIFLGSVPISVTDAGGAKTCLGDIPIRIDITPDQVVKIDYLRLVASGLPPGTEVGEGDTSQYVECIASDRGFTHRGVLDAAAGTIGGFELPDQVSASLDVSVDDDMLASIKGTLDATDFLMNWTVDIDLTECTKNCPSLDEIRKQLESDS